MISQPLFSEVSWAGWLPARVQLDLSTQHAHRIEWHFLGDTPLLEPFYEQTIALALSRSASADVKRTTSLEFLNEFAKPGVGLPPKGFVFHMSRCGSTLITQMLAAASGNRVISEATVIDSILHCHFQHPEITDDRRAEWLRGLVGALGQPLGGEQLLFIKFDSWHTLDLPFIRRVFPSVPWIFVYRHPLEVVASHARQDPGPMNLESAAHRVRVLRRFCETALSALDANGILVEYNELPEGVASRILPHFGVLPTEEQIIQMMRQSYFDAKDPTHSRRFTSDIDAKQRELPVEVRKLVKQMLLPMYEQLEHHRVSRRISSI